MLYTYTLIDCLTVCLSMQWFIYWLVLRAIWNSGEHVTAWSYCLTASRPCSMWKGNPKTFPNYIITWISWWSWRCLNTKTRKSLSSSLLNVVLHSWRCSSHIRKTSLRNFWKCWWLLILCWILFCKQHVKIIFITVLRISMIHQLKMIFQLFDLFLWKPCFN